MPISNVIQTRSASDDRLRRTACRDFSYGQCYHPDCRFSHSIIDCSRLACLNQDTSIADDSSKARLTLEYNASAPSSALHGASGVWIVNLQGDQCSRTVKSKNAVEAFKSIETQLGRPACVVRYLSRCSHLILLIPQYSILRRKQTHVKSSARDTFPVAVQQAAPVTIVTICLIPVGSKSSARNCRVSVVHPKTQTSLSRTHTAPHLTLANGVLLLPSYKITTFGQRTSLWIPISVLL